MSNCDDVLDNWEDIDADKLETAFSNLSTYGSSATDNSSSLAEQMVTNSDTHQSTSATSTTTMELLQSSSEHNGVTSTSATNTASVTVTTTPSKSLMVSGNIQIGAQLLNNNFHPVTMVLHKSEEEYQSANYTAPIANQTVKILRRPIQSVEPRNNEIRPKQPLKSLKQREQEYAEARLRIMGEAKNPEDECVSLNTSETQPQLLNSSTPPVTNNVVVYNAATKTSNTLRNVNNCGITNQYDNSYSQQHQYQQQLPLHIQQQQQQQQLQQLSSQSQLQQYQQNFNFNSQSYYYSIQQQQQIHQKHQQQHQHLQSHKSLPAFNNNRTQSMPLLGQAPLPRHMLSGGASAAAIIGGNGSDPINAQYPASMVTPTNYQQQQQQLQLQQSSFHHTILQQQPQQQQQQPSVYHQSKLQQQAWSPVVGGKVSYTSVRYQQQQQQQQQSHQQSESVLRSPRGPDSTSGFQIRR